MRHGAGVVWWLLPLSVLHTLLLLRMPTEPPARDARWPNGTGAMSSWWPADAQADCDAIVAGDAAAVQRALQAAERRPPPRHDQFDIAAADCSELKLRWRLPDRPATDAEAAFPLAFSVLLHDQPDQLAALLALIYQPHNLYCVHVDAKSSPAVHRAVRQLAACFANVLVAPPLAILYASVDRILAELRCMRILISNPFYRWRYVLNLVSRDFPLRTNAELVQILQSFGGANDVEGLYNRRIKQRFVYSWTRTKAAPDCSLRNPVVQYDCHSDYLSSFGQPKRPPPALLSIVRGSAYGAFSHDFVRFVLFESPHARLLLNWSHDTYSPDEHYWATLNFLKVNPHLSTPGGYAGTPHKKRWWAKFAQWGPPCNGRLVRGVCEFGLSDVAALVRRPELFANKLSIDFQRPTYQCLASWFRRRARRPPAVDVARYAFG